MTYSRTVRVASLAGAAAGVLLLGTPAFAGNPAPDPADATLRQHGVTASGTTCEFGPAADQVPNYAFDVWVFVLPDAKNAFVSLRLGFAPPGSPNAITTVLLPDTGAQHPSGMAGNTGSAGGAGASKAWVAMPAGMTLASGTAKVGGPQPPDKFNGGSTCANRPGSAGAGSAAGGAAQGNAAGTGTQADTGQATGTGQNAGGDDATAAGDAGPTGQDAAAAAASSSAPAAAARAAASGGLPVTGPALVATAVTGTAMVVGGVLLLRRRRRRALRFSAE